MAIVRGSRTIKLKEKIKHIRIATNGSQFQGSLPASITLKALAFNFTPVSYNWYKGESTTSIGSNSVLVVPNNTVAKVETFKVIVKEKDGTAYEEVISITKVVDGQGSQGLNGKMIIQREWKKGNVYRNNNELIDYIYHRATNTWWKLKPGYTNVTADTNPGGQFEKVTAMEELALTNVIAEGGNIAGFIFKDGKLLSQYPNTTNPNLILDGTTGKLIAKDAEISGKITIGTGSPALDQIDKIANDKANEAVSGIEVGGTNLIPNFKNKKWTIHKNASINDDNYSIIHKGTTGQGAQNRSYIIIDVIPGETYTFSYYMEGLPEPVLSVRQIDENDKQQGLLDANYNNGYYKCTKKIGNNIFKLQFELGGRDLPTDEKGIMFKNLKLEKGNVATDWSPAPEDISNSITIVEEDGKNHFYSKTEYLDYSIASNIVSLNTISKLLAIPINKDGYWTISNIFKSTLQRVGYIKDKVVLGAKVYDLDLNTVFPKTLNVVDAKYLLVQCASKDFSSFAPTLKIEKGKSSSEWTPSDRDVIDMIVDNEVYVEYSVTGTTAWHFPATASDRFMRQKKGDAAWSAALPFGKDGKDGLPGKDGKDGAQGPKGSDGVNGAPGKAGVNGKTPFFHTAYANSADGSVGFSLSDSKDKAFWGNYKDFTANNSKDPTRYTWIKVRGEGITSNVAPDTPYEGMLWVDISKTPSEQKVYTGGKWIVVGLGIDDIEIGGRNLLLDSQKWVAQKGKDTILGVDNVGSLRVGSAQLFTTYQTYSQRLMVGETYTWSMLVASKGSITSVDLYTGNVFPYTKLTNIENINNSGFVKVWVTAKVTSTNVTNSRFHFTVTGTEGSLVYFTNLKVEKGNKATDWSPAPEDVQVEIDKANAEAADAKQKAEEAKREAANLKTTTDKLEAKTNYLSTTIDGNVVTTGTVQVGDANNKAKAGVTGVKGTKANERVVFYAGSSFAARENAPVQIWDNGLLVAKNANIEGTVKANAGYFGGFKIESNKIASQDNQFEINSSNGTITYKDPKGKVLWYISKDGVYFSDRSPETYTKISYRKLNADKDSDVLALIAALGSYGYIEVREAVQIKNIKEVREGGSLKYINTGNVTVGLVKKTSSVHGGGGRGGVLEPGSDLPYGFEYGDFVYYPFGYKYNAGVNEASFQNEKNNGKIFTEQTTSSEELKLADGWWVNEVLHKGVIDYITKDSKIDYTDTRNTPLRNFPVNVEFKYYENGKVVKTLVGVKQYDLLEGYQASAVIADTPSTWWKFY